MSSAGNLISSSYTQETVNLGEKNKNVVVGFIAQSRVSQVGDFEMHPVSFILGESTGLKS